MRFRGTPGFDKRFQPRGVDEAMEHAARKLAQAVRDETPRGATGAAKRSIRADGDKVISTDSFWHLIEWGGAFNPAYAPMRRAIRRVGLRFDESRI